MSGINITSTTSNQFAPKLVESGLFTMSADDSTLTAGTIVAFDSTNRNTGIEFDSGNNRWKLKANKTYRLSAFLAPEYSSSSGVYRARFYDITNTAYMGLSSFCVPPTYSSNVSQQPSSKAEITPSTDIYVGLYTEGVSLTSKIEADYSYVEIQEIQSSETPNTYPFLVNAQQYDLTVTGTSWTTTRAVGVFYQTTDGAWRMKFNITGSFTSGSGTYLTVTGISWYGVKQGIAMYNGPSDKVCKAGLENSSGWKIWVSQETANTSEIGLSGDLELNSKPSII